MNIRPYLHVYGVEGSDVSSVIVPSATEEADSSVVETVEPIATSAVPETAVSWFAIFSWLLSTDSIPILGRGRGANQWSFRKQCRAQRSYLRGLSIRSASIDLKGLILDDEPSNSENYSLLVGIISLALATRNNLFRDILPLDSQPSVILFSYPTPPSRVIRLFWIRIFYYITYLSGPPRPHFHSWIPCLFLKFIFRCDGPCHVRSEAIPCGRQCIA